MRRSRAVLWLALVLVAWGCGPGSSQSATAPDLDQDREAIVGGTVDTTDTFTYVLILSYFGSTPNAPPLAQAACTGTLIGPGIIVTAAHCVDPRPSSGLAPSGTTSMQIAASNVYSTSVAGQGDYIFAGPFQYAPTWDPSTLEGDVGMIKLTSLPNQTPKLWNKADISQLDGGAIRAIGYGTTGPNDQSNVQTRREVNLTIGQIIPDHFEVGNGTTAGICHGDSGGPSLFTFPDGVEREVGIHSFTAATPAGQQCLQGADTRIDAFQDWITQWLIDNSAASCASDNVCVPGCNPVDPDCVPVGQACNAVSQCDGRQCQSDPQHLQTYCTQACTGASACPSGMDCTGGYCQFHQQPPANLGDPCTQGVTPCETGTTCTSPPGEATRCYQSCTTSADCPSGEPCQTGTGNIQYCRSVVPPVQLLAAPTQVGTQPTGCGAAPSSGMPIGWLTGAFLWFAMVEPKRRKPACSSTSPFGTLMRSTR